jgi:carbon monoxide dehydrogenase subunit G
MASRSGFCRRSIFRNAVCAVALGAAGTMPVHTRGVDNERHQPDVAVEEERGVYSVNARFRVSQPPAVALAVLTDYERIPRFMPGIEKSVVVARSAGRAVIEQDAVSQFLMFRKRVHLVLEVVEGPDTVQFHDRSRASFARYQGTWRLCEQDGGTWITYALTAQPAFDVPEFILKRLLKRDSNQMIGSLQREIVARGGDDRIPAPPPERWLRRPAGGGSRASDPPAAELSRGVRP